MRISAHEALLTVRHGWRPSSVLVSSRRGWRRARHVMFRRREVQAQIPVARGARFVRVMMISRAHRARLRVSVRSAEPCGPSITPAPGARPPACWRPYAASSPFNRELPADPRLDPRSAAIVSFVTAPGPPQNIPAGWGGTFKDWGRPTYFSRAGDPRYVLHCTEPWGRCPIEGLTARIPAGARPAGGADAHLTVVDNGWVYGLWAVGAIPPDGGRLDFGYGGRTRLDGDGIGSDRVNGGNAAGFGSAAGILRAEELDAGHVDHAIFITVPCDNGTHVYPAVHSGRPCASASDRAAAPALGQRFQLAMSDAEIDRLHAPPFKQAILRAMAHYGMIVGDTGSDTWALGFESGVEYTSLSRSDRWVELARSWGVPYDSGTGSYALSIRDGIDWPNRLRVIAPCVSARGC